MLCRKTSAVLSVVVLSAALTACGSSTSGVSAASYVKSICTAVGPFEKDVAARSRALNASTISSPAQGKTALQSFLAAVASDTDHAVNQLRAGGTPNVVNGKTISTGIVKAFSELQSAITQAATKAKALPTSSPAAFKAAAQTLGTDIQSSFGGIGSSLGSLKSPALEKAAKSESSCQHLGP